MEHIDKSGWAKAGADLMALPAVQPGDWHGSWASALLGLLAPIYAGPGSRRHWLLAKVRIHLPVA
jgi:hypothetical protein